MSLSPLRQFVLSALLWLPACFLLWFLLSGLVTWPTMRVVGPALDALLPNTIAAVELNGAQVDIVTHLKVAVASGRLGNLEISARPLLYAWSLPLFAGLVMASPVSARRRALQLAIGLPVLWLVVVWGTVFEALKVLVFQAGPLGAAAVEHAGLSADAVALGYQFGYLILPAVTPIVLWVLMNQGFLEELVGWGGEPKPGPAGQTGPEHAGSAPAGLERDQ